MVASGLADQAAQSARTAQASAETSAMERAGNAQVLGQIGGFGLQRALGPNVPRAQGVQGLPTGQQADMFYAG